MRAFPLQKDIFSLKIMEREKTQGLEKARKRHVKFVSLLYCSKGYVINRLSILSHTFLFALRTTQGTYCVAAAAHVFYNLPPKLLLSPSAQKAHWSVKR